MIPQYSSYSTKTTQIMLIVDLKNYRSNIFPIAYTMLPICIQKKIQTGVCGYRSDYIVHY